MRIARRRGVSVRTWPFALGWALLILGLLRGPSWSLSTSLFTGNLLVQLQVPPNLFDPAPVHLLWILAGVAGLALVVYSHIPSLTGSGRRLQFYPLVLLLGLFLAVFGAIFLFDATFTGAQSVGGSVGYVYLNYADLAARPVQSAIGGLILGAGLAIVVGGSLGTAGTVAEKARQPGPPAAT